MACKRQAIRMTETKAVRKAMHGSAARSEPLLANAAQAVHAARMALQEAVVTLRDSQVVLRGLVPCAPLAHCSRLNPFCGNQAVNAARMALREAVVTLKDSQVAEDELVKRGPDVTGSEPGDMQREIAERQHQLVLLQHEVF